MDRAEIQRRLRALPPEAAAAFAARVAMRWLPLLSVMPGTDVSPRLDNYHRPAFYYWREEEKRQPFLLAILYAQAGAVCVGLSSAIARKNTFSRRRTASAAASAASAAASAAESIDAYANAAYAYTAAAAAYAAAAADAAADAVADTAAAAAATTYAAVYARRIALFAVKGDSNVIWEQYDCDLSCLERKTIPSLLAMPLWQSTPPTIWQQHWDLFSEQLMALDASFAIWLRWLEERIAGQPIDLPMLEQWLDLPTEIESQSPAAINQYLASLGHAKQALNHVRTIFIGYGEAGKTSLIRTLHGEPVVEGKEPMTPGIQIREWHGAGNDLTTHFWDFGGQVMAHATHQFFLRASCLYVLLLSARAEVNATEQAEYWLQHVQAFGGNATVLIVGNKDDQTPVHIDMASLQAKYPNVRGFYPLSCTQAQTPGAYQHKFNAFRADFCQHLTELGAHQVMLTDAQFKVLKKLRQRAARQAFLKHAEFDTLCQQHKIGQDGGQTQENFLDLLDKLGIVIHFKDLPYLSEHVLNPRWLTYGVYTVMYAQRARLSLPEIVTLLSKTEVCDETGQTLPYPPEKCHFIATAMRYFKLCYHLPHDPNSFIIPGLLETDQPAALRQSNFYKSQSLAYKIVFTGFVPRHVMPELIVENNEAIENYVVWQYGVLLRHRESNARALAQVDYQARELTIWVRGEAAREYMSHLREDLRRILSRLTMKYEEQIRLPVAARLGQASLIDPEEDWAGYQQIESFLKDGAKTFISTSGIKYNLRKAAGLYVNLAMHKKGGNIYHLYGEQAKIIHTAGHVEGDKSMSIADSEICGPVSMVDKAENSFNASSHNNPELQQLLAEIQAEIAALKAQIPAVHAAAIAEEANALAEETRREQPRARWYQASLGGLVEAAEKLGAVGTPLLEQVAKVKGLLAS